MRTLEIIKKMPVLRSIERAVRDHYKQQFRIERKVLHDSIPKTALSQRHIANCRLVLDRRAMIQEIPKDSVGAEIGVDEGEFTVQLLETGNFQKLVLIDIWISDRYSEDKADHVKNQFASELESGLAEIVRERSIEAASLFPDAYFDWIYIDTDHSFQTTLDELYAWAPKIKPGGVISGHDYVRGNWISTYRYGVIEAVHKFCVDEDWELAALTVNRTENPSFAIRKIENSRSE